MPQETSVYFVTKGFQKSKDGTKKPFEYRTKKLTPYHAAIRKANPNAYTIRCEKSPNAPLGIFAVLIEPSTEQKV